MPTPVVERVNELTQMVARNPNPSTRSPRGRSSRDAAELVADFLNGDERGLAFVVNATSAASIIAASARFETGDEILVTSHAYGAVHIGVERYATDVGAACIRARCRSTCGRSPTRASRCGSAICTSGSAHHRDAVSCTRDRGIGTTCAHSWSRGTSTLATRLRCGFREPRISRPGWLRRLPSTSTVAWATSGSATTACGSPAPVRSWWRGRWASIGSPCPSPARISAG